MKLFAFLLMMIAGPATPATTGNTDCLAEESNHTLSVNATAFVIESVQFPGVFLRMNGSGVTKPLAPGGGQVNCQYGSGAYEHFYFDKISNGVYSIRSKQFNNVALRMNGPANQVNCQYGVGGPYEKFRLRHVEGNVYGIESVQFPGTYLRMDGSGVTKPVAPGGGTVNTQNRMASYEKFRIYAPGNPRVRPDGSVSANSGRGNTNNNSGRGNNSNTSGRGSNNNSGGGGMIKR